MFLGNQMLSLFSKEKLFINLNRNSNLRIDVN